MEFGIGYFRTHDAVSPGALAQLVEERSHESLFFAEHTHIPASRATADAQCRPHLVPVVFAVRDETIYSAVDAKPKRTTKLRRLANVTENPAVSLLVDHYEDDWEALWWVRADGRGRVLDGDEPEARQAIEWLRARYPQQQATGAVLAVDVERWAGWAAGAGDGLGHEGADVGQAGERVLRVLRVDAPDAVADDRDP